LRPAALWEFVASYSILAYIFLPTIKELCFTKSYDSDIVIPPPLNHVNSILNGREFLNNNKASEAERFLRRSVPFKPAVALILGSGIGNLSDNIDVHHTVHGGEIPHYPIPTVDGHDGTLNFGFFRKDKSHSFPLLVFKGRMHYYETGIIGHAAFAVVLAKKLGAGIALFTNAAGGINRNLKKGDIMLITDFLSFFNMSPFCTEYFPSTRKKEYLDMELKRKALVCAVKYSIPLKLGTYCWIKGPSYETPSEIKALKEIGADAVGMSTLPETIVAASLKMRTLCFSLISNLAAGTGRDRISHEEVKEAAKICSGNLFSLLENIIVPAR
jgi:purine-nucleoside phosphorylase